MVESSPVCYLLDRNDLILEVNDAWAEFAVANNGTGLLPPAIIGRSVWDFVHDPVTTLIYRGLHERIRSGHGPARFAFRCDSPSVRRLLEMTMTLGADGSLACVVGTRAIQHRPSQSILDQDDPGTGQILRICSWCKRMPDGEGEWVEIEEALARLDLLAGQVPQAVTHGICDACCQSMLAVLDDPALGESERLTLGTLPAA